MSDDTKTVFNSGWIDVALLQPRLNNLASEELLFVCDGKVRAGYFHVNGCFYSSDREVAAYTDLSDKNRLLPERKVKWWQPFPKPPSVQTESEES